MKILNLFLTLSLCCSIFLSKAQTENRSQFPDRIMLTWSDDPATTQSVSWRSFQPLEAIVGQIVEETSSPDLEANAKTVSGTQTYLKIQGGGEDVYRQVTFRDLKPSTVYVYRVGDGKNWSAWNQFRTAGPSGDFSFIYLGDAQNDLRSRWSRTVRKAFQQEANARFIVHAGDLITRSNNDKEWAEWYEATGFIHQMIPAVPAPGNHEYRRDSLKKLILDPHWNIQFPLPKNGPEGLPEVNYLDYQDVRMVSLNTNLILHDPAAAEKQVKWLEKVLSSSKKTWNIVVMHHPVYSAAKNRDNAVIRDHIKPVLEKYNVDLVLQGHDHAYARGAAGRVRPVYAVSIAGPKMYSGTADQWMDVSTTKTQLYQVIRVTGDKLYYSSYKLTGELFDSFELPKKQ